VKRRFALALLSVALFVLPDPAHAQSRPSGAQLECMIAKALADPTTVAFARPQILGFGDQPVITHQLHQPHGEIEYSFAVTNPRLRDGLVFFSHRAATRTYRMHRTDTHLGRVTSATNDLRLGDQGLAGWDGASADADFARQLSVWANFKCPSDVVSDVTPRSWGDADPPPGPGPSAR
jgi:hypothetical protein